MSDTGNHTVTDLETDLELARPSWRARLWGAAGALFLAVAFAAGGFLYGQASERGNVIVEQDSLIGSACPLLGERAAEEPLVYQACARVAQGKPAVPAAEDIVETRTTGLRDPAGRHQPPQLITHCDMWLVWRRVAEFRDERTCPIRHDDWHVGERGMDSGARGPLRPEPVSGGCR